MIGCLDKQKKINEHDGELAIKDCGSIAYVMF